MLADENGNVTDTYDYDAFGNLINKTGETKNNYLYCGEQYDGTTGYYYLRARYMNPTSGTFVTMDTYQGAINDPVSLHKYLYANANPVMNIDPTGNSPLLVIQTAQSISAKIDGIVNAYNKVILKAAAIIFSTVSVGAMYMYGNTAADYFGGGNTEDILSGLGDGSIGGCDIGMLAEASVVGALVSGMGITKAALSAISTVQMNSPQSDFYRGLAVIAIFSSLTALEFGDNVIRTEEKDGKFKTPTSHPEDFVKLRNGQGYKDKDGNIWRKDQLHKDHWDISNKKGKKVKEVDFDGNEIWPNGPKNKNKR